MVTKQKGIIMKKLTTLLSVGLATVLLSSLTACGSAPIASATMKSSWLRITTNGAFPTALTGEGAAHESLSYSVAFNQATEGNGSYTLTVNETESYFKTEFYTTTYSWKDAEFYGDSAKNDELVYVFTTEYRIVGEYTITASGEKVAVDDEAESVAYFRAVENKLAPVYSHLETNGTTPQGYSASGKDSFAQTHMLYETYYSYNTAEATVLTENHLTGDTTRSRVTGLDKTGYNVFDNQSLYTVLRSMVGDGQFSQNVSVFVAANGNNAAETYEFRNGNYNVTGSPAAKLNVNSTSGAQIRTALAEAGYCTATADVAYSLLTIRSTNAMAGAAQTALYAAVQNEYNNACKATLLQLNVPLSYSLGSLEFSLLSVDSQFNA